MFIGFTKGSSIYLVKFPWRMKPFPLDLQAKQNSKPYHNKNEAKVDWKSHNNIKRHQLIGTTLKNNGEEK